MIHNQNQPEGIIWVVKVALTTVEKCSYLKKQVEIENNGPDSKKERCLARLIMKRECNGQHNHNTNMLKVPNLEFSK